MHKISRIAQSAQLILNMVKSLLLRKEGIEVANISIEIQYVQVRKPLGKDEDIWHKKLLRRLYKK